MSPAPSGGTTPLVMGSGLRGEHDRSALRDFLLQSQTPEPGFARYGYLLLGKDPQIDRGARAAIAGFLGELPAAARVNLQPFERPDWVITYLPVRTNPSEGGSADDTLARAVEVYDLAGARALMRTARLDGPGPFILVVAQPLAPGEAPTSPAVLDLSGVPEDRMYSWMRLYIRDVASGREWKRQSHSRDGGPAKSTLCFGVEHVSIESLARALPPSDRFAATFVIDACDSANVDLREAPRPASIVSATSRVLRYGVTVTFTCPVEPL